MEIGLPCKWLFASALEGRTITGEFAGTNKVKTKKGEMEAVIFLCGEAEYQIAPFNLVSETKFTPEHQKAELSKVGDNIKVKLL